MDSVCTVCEQYPDGTVYNLPCFVLLFFPIYFIYFLQPESFLQELPHYEVVHPSRVDAKGHFLSNFVSHRVSRLRRRETQDDPGSLARVFYQLQHGDHHLLFNLTLNPQLLAPGFLIERRYGGLEGAKISNRGSSLCHFIGEVWDRATVKGRAAISTCAGLTGLFRLSEEEFFIQPLEHQLVQSISGRVERQRERWERRQRKKRRIRQRSVSREKWVETLVVADSKMVEYHGSSGVESYVLAVMNIVSGLFRDASIGNPINIVVVRLILLEKEEEDLKISHHADNSLNSFCKWQKRLNVKGEENAVHHDVAVLITRKDICAAINKPCETLGLSHVAGMCQPHRSCSISEDTGLPLAFTIAHELGHNFGIQHDGNGNDCEPIGKRPFVMSPQLLYGNARPSWSRCSRQYITRFLDRGWGWCLDDPPLSDVKDLNSVPPGVLYSAAHQCRLQYGSGSLLCDDVDNVCSTLWCTVGVTCHSKLDGAVDGTRCGEDKWCFDGECVAVGYRPESVNGGWAAWSEWSACSRTCGGGVQNAHRDCVNPVPKYGGKYCTGERRRYKICNSSPCPLGQPSFRHVQCNHFNTMPYKGKFYKWVQVNNRVNPCELHCRPVNEYFSEKMLDAAIDGTQCYEGSTSRDMCINGICKNVGCDYKIDSNAVEDRCGVCHGNGSTCETVKKTFEESEGLGYVDIGLIPEGARDIRIEEVAEAGNFLALRSDDPDKYFLNGGWTIQWNGEYKAAGTVFTYERTGHLENLTSPGPTLEPVWIQLLFQETNPGVRYEYTIHRENLLDSDNNIPDFFWKYGSWTECSSTCGTGVQRQIVHCVERTSGIVEDRYCDPTTRPDDKRANCNEELCPAIWWVGEWQKCSATCGEQGLAKRTVLCIQAVGLEEKRALQPSECHHMPRPDSVTACNTHIPCPADWSAGNWSECSLTCGGGVRSREVVCSRNTGVDCDPRKKPPAPPRNRWLEIDYNEILVPPMLRSRGTVSSLTHQPPMGATPTTPRDVKRSMPSTLSPGPTTLPARSPTTPLSAPELTPLPSPVVTAAFWRAGDWSAVSGTILHEFHTYCRCSTSCGLGAIWRLVTCSTGLDTDCGLAERPVPARRCYLRPCSLWRLGNWTKCSKNCGSGVTSREIQCFDTRDQRPLRPFHCQIMSTRPVAQMPCNTQPCLTWYSSSWGQCSEVCGGGEQQRLVTCPEENRCDEDFVPSNIQACNSQPCAQWVTGSWGPCSASCGGGVQRRLVKCVNTKVENEEEHAQCDHEPWPENTQKCNLQDCDSIPAGLTCLRDRLTFRFCQTLRWLGRCHLPTVQAQCCKTCGQRSRGDESSTRR
uniref:ADAM metallopeptidase with thrombospondin type 1 motif 7 n=1 Tax=Esox lucius TaxID=8010 RepID=A0A6Q2XWC8_ESOLU